MCVRTVPSAGRTQSATMACSWNAVWGIVDALCAMYIILFLVTTDPLWMMDVSPTCACNGHDIFTSDVAVAVTMIMIMYMTHFTMESIIYFRQHASLPVSQQLSRAYYGATFVTFTLCVIITPMAWCMRCDDEQTYLGLMWRQWFVYALYLVVGAVVAGLAILVAIFAIFVCGVVLVMRGVYGDPPADSDIAPIVAWLDDKLGNKPRGEPCGDKPPLSAVALSQLDELNMPTE
jgi:hypothetical protein